MHRIDVYKRQVIISAIFLGEKMTIEAGIGSVLILIGVFFANKK